MQTIRACLTACLTVLGLVAAGTSHATHKAWLLKHSGGQCVVQYPRFDDAGYPGILENANPYGVYVSCPVILASRGGSSDGPPVRSQSWLAAKQARVFFRQVRSDFWCQARAEDSYGNVYFGASDRYSPGPGLQVIDLIERETDDFHPGDWGGSLEDEEDNPNFVQLDFECRIGSGSAAAPAQLFGYDIAVCQSSRGCTTVRNDIREGESTVQGNGIECAPTGADGNEFLRRSAFGITNEGDRGYSTHCPITQPADDSYGHNRQVRDVEVVYAGPQPLCLLESYDDTGNRRHSSPLAPDRLYSRTLTLPEVFDTGFGWSLALRCELPPNSTIEGYVSRMSVTRKSGGI